MSPRLAPLVLVVDSDPDAAHLLAARLTELGLRSAVALDGTRALDEFTAREPDSVFIDLELTGLSGLELIDVLRDPRRPRVPIIVADAADQLERIARALSAGADDFVTRPVDPTALALRLRARSAPGLRSANFTPITLKAVDSALAPTDRSYCPACTTLQSKQRAYCRFCNSPAPTTGWPGIEASGLPYLGAVLGGRFLLDRYIDRGSAGEVYRALDLYLKRYYAAKVVDFSGGEHELRLAVEREATALSQLSNPHVVNIYELHELASDRLLVITEFVEGCSVETLVARTGPLRPAVALDIVRQAAQGLHEVHELGMIHRDVKPANLMVQQLPAAGRFVRVLDFGLVRLQGALDRRGSVFGTPRFAAPEQLIQGASVDRRADIYSLGLTLYFMLVGAPPPGGDLDEIVENRMQGVAESLHAVSARLPGASEITPLVRAMSDPDPDRRLQTMAEVIEHVDALAGGRFDTGSWSVV